MKSASSSIVRLKNRRRCFTPALNLSGSAAGTPFNTFHAGPFQAFLSETEHVIGLRIPLLSRFEHDQRAVQPGGELVNVVRVRVIHERARARRREDAR